MPLLSHPWCSLSCLHGSELQEGYNEPLVLPVQVRAVPYWVDDESVRSSMLASAPSPPDGVSVEGASTSAPKPRMLPKPKKVREGNMQPALVSPEEAHEQGAPPLHPSVLLHVLQRHGLLVPPVFRPQVASTSVGLDELSHPLLGNQPTLRLMPDPSEVQVRACTLRGLLFPVMAEINQGYLSSSMLPNHALAKKHPRTVLSVYHATAPQHRTL